MEFILLYLVNGRMNWPQYYITKDIVNKFYFNNPCTLHPTFAALSQSQGLVSAGYACTLHLNLSQ